MFPRTSGTSQDHTLGVELIFVTPPHLRPYPPSILCHFREKGAVAI